MTNVIYHIATAESWERAVTDDLYRPESLAAEGFIHCADADQILAVANAFFQDRASLYLLAIRADEMGESLVYEAPVDPLDAFAAQRFPHVYAPIPLTAITTALPFSRGPTGMFDWPAGMQSDCG